MRKRWVVPTVAVMTALTTGGLAPSAEAASTTYYEVRAQHSDKCLDVAWASQDHAADVIQGTCSGGTNQHWRLVSVGGGYSEIRARHSNKCLDVAWASQDHAADVVQGTCSGGANQHWRFVPTST